MAHAGCPKCGAEFEVDFPAGTEFRCGACGGTVTTPGGAQEPEPAPAYAEADPSEEPDAADSAAPVAAAPRPRSAPRRPTVVASRSVAPAKTNSAVVLLGGTAVLVLLAVVAVFVLKIGGSSEPTQDSPKSAPLQASKMDTPALNGGAAGTVSALPKPGAPTGSRPTDPIAAARFDAEQPNAGIAEWLAIAELLHTAAAEIRLAGDILAFGRLNDEAIAWYRKILAKDKNHAIARERLGFVRFDMAEAQALGKAAYVKAKTKKLIGNVIGDVEEKIAGKPATYPLWMDAQKDDWTAICADWRVAYRAAKAQETEHIEKATDPFYAKARNIAAAIEADAGTFIQGARGRAGPCFEVYTYKPYVILVQKDGGKNNTEGAEDLADEWGDSLLQLRDTFYARFGKRLNLEAMTRPTPVLLLRYDTDYRYYLRGAIVTSGAHYEPWSKRLVTYAGYDRSEGSPIHETFTPDKRRETLFHEGTHQLIDYNTKGNIVSQMNEAFWFSEGIADYFGGHGRRWDTVEGRWLYELGLLSETRLKSLASALRGNSLRSLRDLLNYRRADYQRDKDLPSAQNNVLMGYAQGWALIYYLSEWRDKALRPKFEEYVKKELSGVSGEKAFSEVFGAENIDNLEKDWREMIATLVKAFDDKKIVNGHILK